MLKGTRTPVSLVAEIYRREGSLQRVMDELPHLSPMLVSAALAFYLANRELIDREMAEDQAAYDAAADDHQDASPDS